MSRLLARLVPPAPGPLEPAESLVVLPLTYGVRRRVHVPPLFARLPADLSGRRLVVDAEDLVFAHGAAADEIVRVALVERHADAIFFTGRDMTTYADLRAALDRHGLDPGLLVRRNPAELMAWI